MNDALLDSSAHDSAHHTHLTSGCFYEGCCFEIYTWDVVRFDNGQTICRADRQAGAVVVQWYREWEVLFFHLYGLGNTVPVGCQIAYATKSREH